jgi:cytochrome c
MSTHKYWLTAVLFVASTVAADEEPGLGQLVSPEEIRAVDYSVLPNGEGLPDGSGTAQSGETVYRQNCLACHGEGGTDGLNDRLVGGHGSLTSDRPIKTIGSYWPYATTLFDYVRRAMPFQTPGSLTNDEIYSVTAYLLYLNEIVEQDAEMNARTLPMVKMPNRDNFVWDYTPQ